MRRTAERAGPRLRPRYGIEQFRGYRQRDAIQPARSGTRHPRQRRPEASGHGARRLRRDGQVHALQAAACGGGSSRQLQQPSVQSRATPCTSAQGGRRGPGRTGHARRLQGSGRSGHGPAFQLPEPTGRHHRPGCRGGRPDLHPTDHQPRTVRPRGRGARRRAGHPATKPRAASTCASPSSAWANSAHRN